MKKLVALIIAVLMLAILTAADAKTVRSASVKRQFKVLTGFLHGRAGYQIDHIVPLHCGGPDTIDNMQWLTIEQHKIKTRSELKCGSLNAVKPTMSNSTEAISSP